LLWSLLCLKWNITNFFWLVSVWYIVYYPLIFYLCLSLNLKLISFIQHRVDSPFLIHTDHPADLEQWSSWLASQYSLGWKAPTNAPSYWLWWVLTNFFLVWPWTVILPISASQVARITGVSQWHLASCRFWTLFWPLSDFFLSLPFKGDVKINKFQFYAELSPDF
jgi:hypothetical protein